LLRLATAEPDDELTRIAARVAMDTTPEPVVLVHGSLDPDNVIVKGSRLSGLLDLEAARLGPASYDVASMTTGLAISAGPGRALEWLAACEHAIPEISRTNVCGFLLLRACFRRADGALSPREESSILAVAKTLTLAR
jgi:aminoglycoside phosphotransferase (APT) family kinase protein